MQSREFPPLLTNNSTPLAAAIQTPRLPDLEEGDSSPHPTVPTTQPTTSDTAITSSPYHVNKPVLIATSADTDSPIDLPHSNMPTEVTSRAKRPISSSNSTPQQSTNEHTESLDSDRHTRQQDVSSDDDSTTNTKGKPQAKKVKSAEKTTTVSESLSSVKSYMEENPSEYVINFTQLSSFYENAIGSHDIAKLALTYTQDLQGLAETLRKLYPHLNGNSLKNRTTRLEKKLIAAIGLQRNANTPTPTANPDDNSTPASMTS
ncbi:hypothetical protein C0J52_16021 [Blattella germanica]|nr:hypothetical protein C0J52_16021 [Blattella germanica]